MIPAAFEYHAPRTLADAVRLLGDLPDAKLLAGGHSLLPMMKLRLAQPAHLVDLGRIAELRGISQAGGGIVIGAMTTEHEILASPLLAEKLPLLVEGASLIADPQVRYKGTIGGDISHGVMSLDQLFSARPMLGYAAYRGPLPGLYHCGAGAHPGGGVTGAPGHNAAHAILADQRRRGRSRR